LIEKHFGHSKIEFTVAAAPIFRGGHDGCPKGPFHIPGLLSRVSSRNPKVFGSVEIAVFKLNGDADGYAHLRRSIKSRPASLGEDAIGFPETCAFVGNTPVAAAQVGSYWVEVYGHCYDGALYRYEVGDAISMLLEKDSAVSPTRFALAECGRGAPAFLEVQDFLDQLKKPTSYWGRRFPEARRLAREASVAR
jgi:hypothetical protein